jgi:putative transposase
VFPSERWAATFRSHAQLIIHELSQHLGYTLPSLIDRMAENGQNIHQDRLILQEKLATATQQEIAN